MDEKKTPLLSAELFAIAPPTQTVGAGQVVSFDLGLTKDLTRPNEGQFIGHLIASPFKGEPTARALKLNVPSIDQPTTIEFADGTEDLSYGLDTLRPSTHPIEIVVKNTGDYSTVVTLPRSNAMRSDCA